MRIVAKQVGLRMRVRDELHLPLLLEYADLEPPLHRRAPQPLGGAKPRRILVVQHQTAPLNEALDDAGDTGSLESLDLHFGEVGEIHAEPGAESVGGAPPVPQFRHRLEELAVLLSVPYPLQPEIQPASEIR